MKYILLILTLTLSGFIVMPAYAQEEATDMVCDPLPQSGNFSITCTPKHNPHGFQFTIEGTITDNSGTSQKILVKQNGKLLQELPVDESDDSWTPSAGSLLSSVDANFDGEDDLQLLELTTAGPNVGYYYWLYNAKSGLFERNKDFDVLSGTAVIFTSQTKTFATENRGSAAERSTDGYTLADGKPQLETQTEEGLVYIMEIPSLEDSSLDDYICAKLTKYYDKDNYLERTEIIMPSNSCEDEKEPSTFSMEQLEKLLTDNSVAFTTASDHHTLFIPNK